MHTVADPAFVKQLRKARRQLSLERIQEMMNRYLPMGWTIKAPWKSKKHDGEASWAKGRRISLAKYPYDAYSLYVFLHECGHVFMGHCHPSSHMPLHLEEYEAERWALMILDIEGIKSPGSIVTSAKRNVRKAIGRDLAKQVAITERVQRWCGL